MKLEPGKFCPLIKKDCIGLQCSWFMLVRGKHPQTGQDIDEWNCAMTWLPVLMIENSQQQRQTGAAVESFRNEVVQSAEKSQHLLAADLQHRIAEANKVQTLTYNDTQNNT